MAAADATAVVADTTRDDAAFWLYSSGSTGAPKGTVHVHSSLVSTGELFAKPILGMREDDVVFSSAKLFFAYGLGNSLTFPLVTGATAILMAERPTPAAVFRRLIEHRPTVFCAVPTLFAALLASPDLPRRDQVAIRVCTSAGEALPADIGRRFTEHFGVEILDGLGSTEMLHVYLSNRPGDVRYGTTGMPVPGYELRIVGEDGLPVMRGTWANCRSADPRRRWATGTTGRRAATPSRAAGRAAATNTRSTPTAATCTPGAATTCSRCRASTSRRSRSRRR